MSSNDHRFFKEFEKVLYCTIVLLNRGTTIPWDRTNIISRPTLALFILVIERLCKLALRSYIALRYMYRSYIHTYTIRPKSYVSIYIIVKYLLVP